MANNYQNTKNKGVAAPTTPQLKPLDANDTSSKNQQQIIYRALLLKPQSTIDLRHRYGIMQPAPRIKELREMGHKIVTVRVVEATPDNIKHRSVAKYVLQPTKGEVLA